MIFKQLVAAVPFYEGLTLEELAGHGVRWPAREQAAAMPAGERPTAPRPGASTPARNGGLALGRYRPIWAAPEVEISPALQYTIAHQQVELSPEDARRLGITHGEIVEVSQLDGSGAAQSGEAGGRAGGMPEGTRLRATAAVRTGVPAGAAFLAEGIATDSANLLTSPEIEVHKA